MLVLVESQENFKFTQLDISPIDFTATPGSSPSYIYIQFSQSLNTNSPLNVNNFTVSNLIHETTITPEAIGFITNVLQNDTIKIRFDHNDIDPI